MKIYLEGSVEEIDQFLYGDGVEVVEAEEECKCKCDSEMSPEEQLKLKLKLINSFADRVEKLFNIKKL